MGAGVAQVLVTVCARVCACTGNSNINTKLSLLYDNVTSILCEDKLWQDGEWCALSFCFCQLQPNYRSLSITHRCLTS